MPRALRNLLTWLLIAFLLGSLFCGRPHPGPLRVVTFNIENYPRSVQQEAGAFAAIASSGAAIVAVQEITEPDHFADAARRRLGAAWAFVAADDPTGLHVGVLYDTRRVTLLGQRTRPELAVYDGARPALEAELRPVDGGEPVRLLVLHLKAGGDSAPLRRRQLAALRPVVRELLATGDRLLVLGDFNAATPGDRDELDRLAADTGLHWNTRDLPCTAYWSRRDGCVGSALDQALTNTPAVAEALDPCRTEGCALRPACPSFRREVSDHCPVALDL
jgi:endonuclease/exonuclease/phosphatase family metal-dependent hydrolase